jgi:hypothetical protein
MTGDETRRRLKRVPRWEYPAEWAPRRTLAERFQAQTGFPRTLAAHTNVIAWRRRKNVDVISSMSGINPETCVRCRNKIRS